MKVIVIYKEEYHKENQIYDIPENVGVLRLKDFDEFKEIIIYSPKDEILIIDKKFMKKEKK